MKPTPPSVPAHTSKPPLSLQAQTSTHTPAQIYENMAEASFSAHLYVLGCNSVFLLILRQKHGNKDGKKKN